MAASCTAATLSSRGGRDKRFAVIIVASGAGGGTIARHHTPSGKNLLILERGDRLKREAENCGATAVFDHSRSVSPDVWHNREGRPFQPQVHYFAGGVAARRFLRAHRLVAMVTVGRVLIAGISRRATEAWIDVGLAIFLAITFQLVSRVHNQAEGIMAFGRAGRARSAILPSSISFGGDEFPFRPGGGRAHRLLSARLRRRCVWNRAVEGSGWIFAFQDLHNRGA
jgi:choline dehydrogenase-like flavoprotein